MSLTDPRAAHRRPRLAPLPRAPASHPPASHPPARRPLPLDLIVIDPAARTPIEPLLAPSWAYTRACHLAVFVLSAVISVAFVFWICGAP